MNISGGCKDLLKRMVEYDKDLRMTFEEFYQHPWINAVPYDI